MDNLTDDQFENVFEICLLVDSLALDDPDFQNKTNRYELAHMISRLFNKTYADYDWSESDWSNDIEQFTTDNYSRLKHRFSA